MISLLAVLSALLMGLWVALAVIRHGFSLALELPVSGQWISELAVQRHHPMLRVLDQRDVEFLRAQPGYHPRIETRLRIQRFRVYRSYLKSLDADFKRTCATLRILITQSHQKRPGLGSTLIRAQIEFACRIMVAQFRLSLYRLGWANVDARHLIKLFDGMQGELRSLVSSPVRSIA